MLLDFFCLAFQVTFFHDSVHMHSGTSCASVIIKQTKMACVHLLCTAHSHNSEPYKPY